MMRTAILVLFFFFSFFTYSQSFLAIDHYKIWGMKRIRYHVRDEITLRTRESNIKYRGMIVAIRDSAIFIQERNGAVDSLYLGNIRMIVYDRSNWLTRKLSTFLMEAGIGYILLDTFNNITNGEATIVKPVVVKAGLIVLASGITFKLLLKKRYRIGKRNVLRVMNISPT